MSDYAARIRAARAYADLKQEDLAHALGVTVETVKRRERGKSKRAPKRGELLAIAAVCNVPPSFMERGFDAGEQGAVIERLDRLEAALGMQGPESMRRYAHTVISELREGERDDGSGEPTPQRARGPHRAER